MTLDAQLVATILAVCADAKDLNLGKEVHKLVQKHKLQTNSKRDDIILSNGLINMYAKCGHLDHAQSLSFQFKHV